MTFLQAIFLAIVQGATELFPVSSLGHAVILPAVLGWHIDQDSPGFLPFLVVLHVGTATALLVYFWRDWLGLLLAALGRGGATGRSIGENRHLIVLLVLGTLPAVVLGFVFEKWLRHLFGSPVAAAFFLIANGVVLFAGERLRRRADAARDRKRLAQASWGDAIVVGLCQTTAFLPGISRSGATIVGGLLIGLRHEDAARFSFLLATPVIAGAAFLEIPKLLHAAPATGAAAIGGGVLWVAGMVAGVVAYASTAFLMRYFRHREENAALDPFAYYCWLAGALALIYLKIG
ncbi:MAG TPA: undecaprenyl-diphosphate phosphatase [Stellaceae bacterium]|jgi:undecaprenyl-diphosphatase|nr:undecaprenyl-diphosphate phosphatase [Stellaceae bacterium]